MMTIGAFAMIEGFLALLSPTLFMTAGAHSRVESCRLGLDPPRPRRPDAGHRAEPAPRDAEMGSRPRYGARSDQDAGPACVAACFPIWSIVIIAYGLLVLCAIATTWV